MFSSLIQLVLCIVILVSASFAASEPTSPPGPPTETSTATETSTTLRSSSGLLLESFAQPRQIEIPSRFNIVFRIHNATPESVELYDFKLLPVDIPWAIDSDCTVQQVVIDRNSFHHIPCAIFTKGFEDSGLSVFQTLIFSWSALTVSPGDYRLVATAIVKIPTASPVQGDVNVVLSRGISLRIVPSVWQAVLGAFVGSIMMALFWVLSPKVRKYIDDDPRPKTHDVSLGRSARFWRTTRQVFTLALGSATAASIVILLTFRMKDVSLPFTLSVNDFYGGLVVGLFGVVLTKWLVPKLFGDDESDKR